ncbi:hypothetical protein SAY87_017687 [Trapa incisa]|uniref:Response regulatory domain-containing protein n=1 Tax=Trapa incisa TaxID=236973 RepID=A0AAN7QVJ4_9MYRT|nr:hypothetical protein SAY87_017687 [Trapa incisa]
MGVAAESSQFHVLAVDDSIIDRKLIERLLKTSSYQVTTVDSGSKALEFLGLVEDEHRRLDSPSVSSSHAHHVNFSQFHLFYDVHGVPEILFWYQESSSLRNIPVVIMSSENVPSRINRCLEEGAEEFFLKPVRLSDVHRLKPHMMKTKVKGCHQSQEKREEDQEEELEKCPECEIQLIGKQQQSEHQNSNKRKSMEEGLSPDRTRPRYSDVAAVV